MAKSTRPYKRNRHGYIIMTLDKECPKCHNKSISMKYYIGAGRAYECNKCHKMWGWYYDRNLPENKNKPNPDN